MPNGIRPTQDKVRKAIFDILGDIEGLSFLELFAGSGAIGLEAASRGVKEVVLVEYNRDCQLAIEKNIASLKARACFLYPKEAESAIMRLCKEGRIFDIIFLDPPYDKVTFLKPGDKSDKGGLARDVEGHCASLAKKTLQTLVAYDILAAGGFLIIEHFKKDDLPSTLGELILWKHARYGDTVVSFYRKGLT